MMTIKTAPKPLGNGIGFAVHRLETVNAFHTRRPSGCEEWLLIYNLSGGAFFHGPQATVETRPGDAILIAPRTPHDYGSRGVANYVRLFASFTARESWRELLHWPQPFPGVGRIRVAEPAARRRVLHGFSSALDSFHGIARRREFLATNALERVLLLLDAANPTTGGTGQDGRILRTAAWLSRHLDHGWTLGQMAQHAGLSPSHFAALFKAQYHDTPQRYLEGRRLDLAAELLRFSSQPVREVAAQVGFQDALYFSHRFKRRFGKCPRHYRRALGE